MRLEWELILALFFTLAGVQAQENVPSTGAANSYPPEHYLSLAQSSDGDIEQQFLHAQQAAYLFRKARNHEKFLEAQLLLLKAAIYKPDSLIFEKEIKSVFEVAHSLRDTATLVKAYFYQGMFYFEEGEFSRGIESFKKPDALGLYNRKSVDDNVSILGALVDLSLSFDHDLEAGLTYIDRLHLLADTYDVPSAHLVSYMKMGFLFSKSYNFDQSNKFLRKAYPYLDKVENKGYLSHFYRRLIHNFIESGEPDSAAFYLEQLNEKVSYPKGDPMYCQTRIIEGRVRAEMGETDILAPEFMQCYESYVTRDNPLQKRGVMVEIALYVKAKAHANRKEWKLSIEEAERLLDATRLNNDHLFMMRGYEFLYEGWFNLGRKDKALEAHIKFKQYTDSVNQYVFKQGEQLFDAQLALWASNEQNKQLAIDKKKVESLVYQKNSSLIMVALGLVVMIGIAFFFSQLSHQRKKQKEMLSREVVERTAELGRGQ